MSVISKNPFDLLGDDGEETSPGIAKTPAAAAKPVDPPAQTRAVPGSAQRGRGGAREPRYPSRGGPRNVSRDAGPRNSGPTSSEGVAEGMENPGGFDGERVPPSRKGNHVRDAHTKGPRGAARNLTSGGHSSRGAGHVRGTRAPAQGGERRQFERRSGALPDSQKKVDQGWGANEGTAELNAEVEGEKDAVAEENAPQTPAVEGDDGGWGAADETGAPAETEQKPEVAAEPEEVQKSLDEYLAERAKSTVGLGKKEVRQVTDTLEGTAFVREGIDEFFSGKEKQTTKAKAPKKEKVYIEVDGQFASPAGSRPTRGSGERGRGGRGRGSRGGPTPGSSRGRGFGRGRGGFGGQGVNPSDESAFPALGA